MPGQRNRGPREPVKIEVVVLPRNHRQVVGGEAVDVVRDPSASPPRLTVSEKVAPDVLGEQILKMAAKTARRGGDEPSRYDALGRLAEAMHLSYLVYDALPESSPVHRAFKTLDAEYEAADTGKLRASTVQAALDAFYRLPQHEQRRVLNGWRPAPCRPTRREMREEFANPERCDAEVQRVLVLLADAKQGRVLRDELRQRAAAANLPAPLGDDAPVAFMEFALDGWAAPIEVRLVEGTTKDDAVRGLLEITRKLAAGWDELVDQVPPSPGQPAEPEDDAWPMMGAA
jgi:hypothetical protein